MLEDALTDRDLVHRQTASTIVKHLALGVAGLGCEDSMLHLMNLVWPNCFETSPHVIGAVMDAIEAMRVTLGPGVLLSYTLQGLFHPARKVREVSYETFIFVTHCGLRYDLGVLAHIQLTLSWGSRRFSAVLSGCRRAERGKQRLRSQYVAGFHMMLYGCRYSDCKSVVIFLTQCLLACSIYGTTALVYRINLAECCVRCCYQLPSLRDWTYWGNCVSSVRVCLKLLTKQIYCQ
jgi:hypothetical protein